jgi:glutamate/aspartate transport system substrate-binding protein
LNPRYLLSALLAAMLPALALAQGLEGRLKQIRDTKTVAIAHRTDARPFAFLDEAKQPTGYSIDLCKRVVSQLDQSLGSPGLRIKWVPVTTQNRFEVLASGQADMECGASTVTLGRMKLVDFSNYIFVDGTALLARADLNARSLADFSGRKIGVVGGTSNEAAVALALKERLVNASVVKLANRDEGVAQLEAGQIDALASDAVLLLGLAPKVKNAKAFVMVDDSLSFEPYAIALPRNEGALRVEVNSALARIYRSQAIGDIYGQWFGSLGKPGPVLRAVYGMGAIPE